MGKRRFFCFAGVALLAMLAAAALAAGSSGAVRDHGTKDKPVGAVYSETNDFGQNAVVVFDRYANGLIVQRSTVPTGGTGAGLPQLGCPAPCPFLDDQAPLELSKDGRFLFAVNAGSNTISSFRVTAHGLTLIGQVASGGQFPYSVTSPRKPAVRAERREPRHRGLPDLGIGQADSDRRIPETAQRGCERRRTPRGRSASTIPGAYWP